MKVITPNQGHIAMAMAAIMGNSISPWEKIAQLRQLAAQVKPSPQPRRFTGIAKSRRAARKRRNILARTSKR